MLTVLQRRISERSTSGGLRKPPVALAKPRIPAGFRVYAIGDIHGRDDLLERLHTRMAADMQQAPEAYRVLVYLGDYIDRGPDSRKVVERVLSFRPERTERVFLKGNHEAAMLSVLQGDLSGVRDWMNYGGQATLASYGLQMNAQTIADRRQLEGLQQKLLATIPEQHRHFYTALLPSFGIGDYLFVHAGVNPAVPLEQQGEEDLLWIREPFLQCRHYLGKIVVHGHTISPAPEERLHRIGIDTGAYATGRLTAVVLSGDQRLFLQT